MEFIMASSDALERIDGSGVSDGLRTLVLGDRLRDVTTPVKFEYIEDDEPHIVRGVD